MQLSGDPGSSLASVWAMKPLSPWHLRSLPGDGCPFSMLVAHGWVVARSWSLWPPHKSFL